MNKNINSALFVFNEIRDRYNTARTQGKSQIEAHQDVIIAFPDLPIVEIAAALTIISDDYEKRQTKHRDQPKANLYMVISQKGVGQQRSLTL